MKDVNHTTTCNSIKWDYTLSPKVRHFSTRNPSSCSYTDLIVEVPANTHPHPFQDWWRRLWETKFSPYFCSPKIKTTQIKKKNHTYRMDDNASTQLRSKVHCINRNRLSATSSPFGKTVMVFPPRPTEGTSNITSTNALLNIIIQTLHYQTKVIAEKINTSVIWKKPETMRAM